VIEGRRCLAEERRDIRVGDVVEGQVAFEVPVAPDQQQVHQPVAE
jgi:hypothetical protein